jgi:hypothetical protein
MRNLELQVGKYTAELANRCTELENFIANGLPEAIGLALKQRLAEERVGIDASIKQAKAEFAAALEGLRGEIATERRIADLEARLAASEQRAAPTTPALRVAR